MAVTEKEQEWLWFGGILALIGAVIGLGKLLQSKEPLTLRLAIGRMIVTSGLSVGAFTLLVFIPDASKPLIVGVAVMIGSIGESSIEAIVRNYLSKQ